MIFSPRPTDYVYGDGQLKLKGLPAGNAGTWLPYIEFFESQLIEGQDSDGCVLFTTQEDFDAQINLMIITGQITPATLELFNQLGYMDTNSLDGKAHFHSSPRFLQVMTGNGFNGNNVYDGWDVIRNYGVLPWSDLPVDRTIDAKEYLAPISPASVAKAAQFLAAIGGKPSIGYQWICNGTENFTAIRNALQASPLCFGVELNDMGWNQSVPTPPSAGNSPTHCVMGYDIDDGNNLYVYDHYVPASKKLTPNYPMLFAFQGIVTINPPSPAPIFPTPVPPATTVTTQQTQTWLQQLVQWLQGIDNTLKGRK